MMYSSLWSLRLVQLMVLIFVGAVTSATYLYSATQQFIATGVHTQGTVIAYNEHHDSEGTDYTVRITFSDRAGRTYTTDSSFHAATPQYEIGKTVEIVYNPKNPLDATVISFWDLYLWPFVLGVVAFSSLVSSLVMYFVVYKKSLPPSVSLS